VPGHLDVERHRAGTDDPETVRGLSLLEHPVSFWDVDLVGHLHQTGVVFG
jgi:hypothetical protein